jgi:anti-anti-sigma factor
VTGFAATVRSTPAGIVLEFTGTLDATTAPQALHAITDLVLYQGQQLVVVLSALKFCDSSGISALLAARRTALTARAGMALVGMPHHLVRTFTRVGLNSAFSTYPTLEDAHAAWTSS